MVCRSWLTASASGPGHQGELCDITLENFGVGLVLPGRRLLAEAAAAPLIQLFS
jgi:hypothetical protein